MKKSLTYLILCCMIPLGGCATIICGKHQTIPVSSDPPGARVTADDGTTITTPGQVTLRRGDKHTLVAEYPGMETQQINIDQRLNNWIWAGILLDFGIISIPTDFATGASNELTPGKVHFNFADD